MFYKSFDNIYKVHSLERCMKQALLSLLNCDEDNVEIFKQYLRVHDVNISAGISLLSALEVFDPLNIESTTSYTELEDNYYGATKMSVSDLTLFAYKSFFSREESDTVLNSDYDVTREVLERAQDMSFVVTFSNHQYLARNILLRDLESARNGLYNPTVDSMIRRKREEQGISSLSQLLGL